MVISLKEKHKESWRKGNLIGKLIVITRNHEFKEKNENAIWTTFLY